jgi:Ca2+-dependent lipid-binding protein
VSARGLFDMDVFSKSDPYVKVYFKRVPNQPFVLLGRTETIDNNLNPNFKKSFMVDFIFEARQELKFEVMDEDDKLDSKNDDFIGSVETTLGAMAGARDQTLILSLNNPKKNNVGKIILRVEPCNNAKRKLLLI